MPKDDTLIRALRELLAWCDERRDAPTVTTLGMMQEKIRALLRRAGASQNYPTNTSATTEAFE